MQANTQDQYKKMTETPVQQLIPALAVPTIISMLVSAIYNMADTFFVSKIGTSATGAVGVVFSIMAVLQAFGFLFGMGAGSNISRMLGQQQNEAANRIATSAVGATFTLGAFITMLGIIFIEPILSHLGATPTIQPYAESYAQYIFLGAPFICTSFVLNNILRSQGNAMFSMIGIAFGGILNIILDPIFIFVFKMGISGAAIATVISQIVSFSILLGCFLKGRSIVQLHSKYMSWKWEIHRLIIVTGFPSFARQGLASMAAILLNTSAGTFGDAAVAGMSIVARISFLIIAIILGFGQGFQPVVGYAYGAKKYRRVREAFRFSLTFATLVLVFLALGCFIFAPQIMSLFRTGDADVICIGTYALRAQCVSLPIQALIILSNMLLQTTGKSREATFLSSARQGTFFVPLILVLPQLAGITGVQLAQPIADVLAGVFSAYFLFKFFNAMPREDFV